MKPTRIIEVNQEPEQLGLMLPDRPAPCAAETGQLCFDFRHPFQFQFDIPHQGRHALIARSEIELEPYDSPITQIIQDNSLRNIEEAEDRHFLELVGLTVQHVDLAEPGSERTVVFSDSGIRMVFTPES
jgi:hypothetical protein